MSLEKKVFFYNLTTVEPVYNGHLGTKIFGLCTEVAAQLNILPKAATRDMLVLGHYIEVLCTSYSTFLAKFIVVIVCSVLYINDDIYKEL